MRISKMMRNLHQAEPRGRKGSLERFTERIQRQDGLGDKDVVFTRPTSGLKISEALIELVRPYLDAAPTEKAQRALISIGQLAWNLTVMPEKDIPDLLDRSASLIPNERETGRAIIKMLMARKRALFPDVRRFIMNVEVVACGKDDYRVNVASTEVPPEESQGVERPPGGPD